MRSFLSILSSVVLALIISLGAFILLIPSVVNTDWGRKQVVSWISQSIPGSIEIKKLQLQWGHGQLIEGFLLKDPKGKAVLEFDTFTTDATLWQLIKQDLSWGPTQLLNVNAAIITDGHGETNLQEALGTLSSRSTPPLAPSTIVLSEANFEGDLFTPNHPFLVKLKGKTRQKDITGSFDISIFLPGFTPSKWETLTENAENYLATEKSKEATLKVQVERFPVDLLDRLTALYSPRLNGVFHSLLGDQLNLTMDKEISDTGLLINLDVQSPSMNGALKGIIKDQTLSLRDPASFHFKLSPEAVNPFVESYFDLLSPSDVYVSFSDLRIPLSFAFPDTKGDPCLFSFTAEIEAPESHIDIDSSDTQISNMNAIISSPSCSKEISIQFTGNALRNKTPFKVDILADFSKPDNLFDLSDKMLRTLSSKLTLSNLPLGVIPFLNQHPELVKKLGSTANVEIKITPRSQSMGWGANLAFKTASTQLTQAQFIITDEITLLKPASLDLTAEQSCLADFFNDDQLKIQTPCALTLSLKRLQVPLEDLLLADFEFEITASPIKLSHFSDLGVLQLNKFKLNVEAKNLGALTSKLQGNLVLEDREGTSSFLLPDPLKIEQTSAWNLSKKGKLELTEAKFLAQNSITKIEMAGSLNPNGFFTLTKAPQFLYNLSPKALEYAGKQLGKNWPKLKETVALDLTINTSSPIDLEHISLSNIQLQGLLKTKKIILQENSKNYPILEDMIVSWMIDTPRNHIYANIKGVASSENERKQSQVSSNIQLWLTPGHYDFAHTKSEIRMNFTGMPTGILNIFLSTPNLTPIIGPILDVNLKAFFDPTQEDAGYLDMAVDSTNLHSDIRFKSSSRLVNADDIKKPIIRLTVTPEGYSHIQKTFSVPGDRSLLAPFTLTLKLADFDVPIENNWMKNGAFNLEISTTEIQWNGDNPSPWSLKGSLKTDASDNQLHFSLGAEAKHSLTFQGTFSNPIAKSEIIDDWRSITLNFKGGGSNVPTTFLQNVLPLNKEHAQQIQAIFGDELSLEIDGKIQNLNGPLHCSASGSQGSIDLDAFLENGTLLLKKPAKGTFNLTPLFTQAFLANNSSLLKTAVGTDTPITVLIQPNNFSCPLFPFELDKLTIGDGVVDLGKIKLRNEGDLKSVLSILKPVSTPFVTIWFTPIHLKLSKGILNLSRFDLLVADSYTVANWGIINLTNHQSEFILGLTAQTLRDAFGIQGLRDNYILQVPLSIKNGKVEVDKKRVTARIGSLLAQTHGGDKGKLLGTILDTVLSETGEPYPPPTTTPFPWENKFKTSSQESNEIKDRIEEKRGNQTNPLEGKKGKKKSKGNHSKETDINALKDSALKALDKWIK